MSAESVGRPRPGGNQFGAGSPSAVQQVAVERFSMTDTMVEPGTWVPRLGDPEISTRLTQFEMAFRMQTSVPELADLSKEPPEILEM